MQNPGTGLRLALTIRWRFATFCLPATHHGELRKWETLPPSQSCTSVLQIETGVSGFGSGEVAEPPDQLEV